MDSPSRDLYVQHALASVPHLIQLLDRNPYSPTYGCLDREYWHYRTLDFPCGMSQEMGLTFALLYQNPYPGNPYHQCERMREFAIASIDFAIKGSRADGSCDDYFPYEQAMGALVFSTYTCTEAYQILGLQDERMAAFFRKRGDYLAKHNETGRLANHQALAALAAYNVFLITGDEAYRRTSDDRAALALSWQHETEGWFQEYEGADPGYHSYSIDLLAKLWRKSGNEALVPPLVKAVQFAGYFMHPDGSYAGEYGSRNSYHYFPHGFEIMAAHTEKAAQMNDAFLRGLARDKRCHNDDDRMCCHLPQNYLQAHDDYYPNRPQPLNARPDFLKWMPDCGLVAAKTPGYYAVANLKKGGVLKAFTEEACAASDTGLIAELDTGRVIVSHLMDPAHSVQADPERGAFTVEGCFSFRRSKLSSPLKMIIFRALNITVGRFFPNLLRLIVQRLLITYKARTPYRFRRSIRFEPDQVVVEDALPDPIPIKRLSAGCDATSIYVANSNVFQESVVRIPWWHAGAGLVAQIRESGASWTRTFPASSNKETDCVPAEPRTPE